MGLLTPENNTDVFGTNAMLNNKISWSDGTGTRVLIGFQSLLLRPFSSAFVHQRWMPDVVKHDAASDGPDGGTGGGHRCFKLDRPDDMRIVDAHCASMNQVLCQSFK